MPNFNRIVLVGHLTRDPELKYTNSGTAVCSFGLAVNHKWGEREEVCFVDVTCFGRTAEVASEYLAKGAPALIEGRLRYQTWETDGQKRSRHDVAADNVQFLPKGKGPEGDIPF